MNNTVFRENLAIYMMRRGFTQKELAKRTGISEAMICRYIRGKVRPMKKNLGLIADALGVPQDELIGPMERVTNDVAFEAVLKSIAENGHLLTTEQKLEVMKRLFLFGNDNI